MSTQSVTVYMYPGASFLFPHILLHHASVVFVPQLALPSDHTILAISPKKQVPVLVLDGFVLNENPTIAWGPYIRPWRFTNDRAHEAAVSAACKDRLLERLEVLEEGLDVEGPWSLGEHSTAIDAFLFHWYRSAESSMKLEMAVKYPRWKRIYDGVAGLEACRKALEIEEAMRADAPPFSQTCCYEEEFRMEGGRTSLTNSLLMTYDSTSLFTTTVLR